MAQREFTSASFYRFLAEKKLMASRCKTCGELYLPCRSLCPKCHGVEMKWQEMSGQGKLVAFTAIAVVPSLMEEEGYGRDNPYLTGIVELEEGPRISARILGLDAKEADKIAVDTPLKVRFIEKGEGESRKTFLGFAP